MAEMESRRAVARQVARLVRLTAALFLVIAASVVAAGVYVRHQSGVNADVVKRQDAALASDHRALAEVCRQTNVLSGAVQVQLDVIRFGSKPSTRKSQVALGNAVETLNGYLSALAEGPACKRITNP